MIDYASSIDPAMSDAMNPPRIDDGGPVFPSEQGHIPNGEWNQTFERGISVRQWLAAQAPPMSKSYHDIFHAKEVAKARRDDRYIIRGELQAECQWRYEWADAMIAAGK